MPLKDLLKKKDKIKQDGASSTRDASAPPGAPSAPPPEFTFIRSTTDMQEVIEPPSFPADDEIHTPHLTIDKDKRPADSSSSRKLGIRLRRSSRNPSPPPSTDPAAASSTSSLPSASLSTASSTTGKAADDRRLSRRLEDKLHIHSRSRSRAASVNSSVRVPDNLPEIDKTGAEDPAAEAEWEKRALLLAQTNERSRPGSPGEGLLNGGAQREGGGVGADGSDETSIDEHRRNISAPEGDVNIQEAIRLHEAGGGDLVRSTHMFRRLADPKGENNALAQVLYGLSLRHGWGCAPDQPAALTYLSLAASNSALVESAALSTGLAAGGAAKGELVLAIYELGNSFRHGWGCGKDPVAARKYYETAANLGDTDAMAEVAWCYLEGFGGKKDKFAAAQYLKMAERKGVSEPGNSWIWKDKYSSPQPSSSQS